MITIEKPGNDELFADYTYKETYKPKRFRCNVCECEFTATKEDYKRKWFSMDDWTGKYKYKVTCPHCLTKLIIYELDTDTTEILEDIREEIRVENSQNDTVSTSEENIIHVPTSIKQVQKAGDHSVQVQVASMTTKSPDTVFHEVLEEVKDKLGLDNVMVAQDITSEKPMKALFQMGDKVVTVSKGFDDFIEDKEHKITSPVYADGKVVHYDDGSSDVDVVKDDDHWFRQDFSGDRYNLYNSDTNVFDLTIHTLRKMHEKESKKEKNKCK